MPWKRCPHCEGLSYSAATRYTKWVCPYCDSDITDVKECEPQRQPEGDKQYRQDQE